MADREKVIKGLKHEVERTKVADLEWLDCIEVSLLRDALELLKAQEPVKPVFERQFMSNIELYDCGKCGTSLGVKGIAK